MTENSNKPKIGIATNWKYPDYGGMIQAYASQLAVEALGCVVEVLDVRNLQSDIDARKMKYFLKNITDLSVVREKSSVVLSSLRRRLPSEYSNGMRERRQAFTTFSSKNFSPSRAFDSWGDLSDSVRNYSCVLVGSDQLWLPSNIMGDYYTLSFVPDGVRIANYATSFGVAAIPDYMKASSKSVP